MFKGVIIIFTAIFSVIFLKKKIYRHQIFGIFVVVSGLCIIGLNSILYAQQHSDSDIHPMGSNPLLGIILIICGQLFSASLYVVEEYLIKKFNAPAIKVVGFEGLCGANIYLVLMFGLYYLRCDSWGTIK